MNARLNILAGVAAGLMLALYHGDAVLIVLVLIVGLAATLFVLRLPRPRASTPTVITRVPTAHEKRDGSRWLYGLFLRVPILSFLSVGLFRWRGRK